MATWNSGNAPPPEDLTPWLPKEGYEIYAIGTQECAYDPRPGYQSCEEDWNSTLVKHFGEEYVNLVAFCITPVVNEKINEAETTRLKQLLKNQTLEAVAELKIAEQEELVSPGEIRISIFVKASLVEHIHSITNSIQTTGRLGGLSGNKGGLCVSFKVGETRIAFFNAHLNAHTEHLVRRNQDVQAIFRGTKGHLPHFEATQANYCFFFGDLNYRVTLPHQETLEVIQEKLWARLLSHDQLLDQQAKGLALANFKESLIRFAPTFKVKRNQPLVYNSERVPSYCDRILHKSYPGLRVLTDFYSSIEYLKTSDHKPVHALFNVDFLPGKNLPESPCAIKEITIADIKAVDLQTQDLAKPHLKVEACLTWSNKEQIVSTASAARGSWKDTLKLDTSEIPLVVLRNSFLLLAVRHVNEDESLVFLGETVVPISDILLQKSINLSQELFQYGLPHGNFVAKITSVKAEGL